MAVIRHNGLFQLPTGYSPSEPTALNVFGFGNVAYRTHASWTFGKKTVGALKPVSLSTQQLLATGELIELHLQTTVPVTDEAGVGNLLLSELPANMKVTYLEVNGQNITVQGLFLEPFSWAALLALLPQILAAAGFIISLISAYLITASIPSWTLGLLVTGILLMGVSQFIKPKKAT